MGNRLGMILRDFEDWSNYKREWNLVWDFGACIKEWHQVEAKDWESVGAADLSDGFTIAFFLAFGQERILFQKVKALWRSKQCKLKMVFKGLFCFSVWRGRLHFDLAWLPILYRSCQSNAYQTSFYQPQLSQETDWPDPLIRDFLVEWIPEPPWNVHWSFFGNNLRPSFYQDSNAWDNYNWCENHYQDPLEQSAAD